MRETSEKRLRASTHNGHPAAKRARGGGRDGIKSRAVELEEEWESLLEMENNCLLKRLVQENRELELTFQQFQIKMESIALCSKECLESTRDVKITNRIASPQHPQPIEENTKRPDQSPRSRAAESSPAFPEVLAPVSGLGPSIVFQATQITRHNLKLDQDVNPNEFCESIMAWKTRSGRCWDFNFLLSHFQWDEIASLMKRGITIDFLKSADFYTRLRESLLNGTELEDCLSQDEPSMSQQWSPSGMMHQRRSAAYCAYVLVKRYRPYAASQSVSVVHFWLISKFLTFLIFPTEENLKDVPRWLWPTHEQLSQDHPGVIDFVIWPGIRSALVKTWQAYKLPELLSDLMLNFDFHGLPNVRGAPILKEASDRTGLFIDPAYQEAVSDMRNYRIGSRFCEKYPDLAQSFGECGRSAQGTAANIIQL